MPSAVRTAVIDDEERVVALWRSCDLVASYNDPGADFRFAVAGTGAAVLVAENTAERIIDCRRLTRP